MKDLESPARHGFKMEVYHGEIAGIATNQSPKEDQESEYYYDHRCPTGVTTQPYVHVARCFDPCLTTALVWQETPRARWKELFAPLDRSIH